MDNIKLAEEKKMIIFELDDVLFPAQDYLLQVYYLFAQFIEYTEQKDASEILEFLRQEYLRDGTANLFKKMVERFNIDEKFKYNFDLLHQNARLPLKLLMYKKMLEFLQHCVTDRKKLYVVTGGSPEEQLNKIKQIEWNGLEKYLTVFFSTELNQSKTEIFERILISNTLTAEYALVVGAGNLDKKESASLNLTYISAEAFYN